MDDLILTTFDWVPEMPRGFVRDIRLRWALEEAGLPYRVESVPFRPRNADHFAHQPFGQVPWLTDGDVSIFESGAILLHLGERSDVLMPTDPRRRCEALEWLFTLAAIAFLAWQSSAFREPDFARVAGERYRDALELRVPILPQAAGTNRLAALCSRYGGWLPPHEREFAAEGAGVCHADARHAIPAAAAAPIEPAAFAELAKAHEAAAAAVAPS